MLEQYQILQKIFMWLIPVFSILALLSGLGWNHYGLKIKEFEKQSKPTKEKTSPKKINNYQIQGDFIKDGKKETSSEVINAPNALIVTNRQSGGENTVNYYQNEFKNPDSYINELIEINLKKLASHFPNHPVISIEIESGNSQRNKVAIQLEAYLINNNLGQFPRGNTNMGRFPDYPVSIFYNPVNKDYIKALIESINPYLKTEYHFEEIAEFPVNYIRFYINGQPLFEPSGKVKIE